MPGKGINGRANMQKFQGNSKKFGGNPFNFQALVNCRNRSRAMCNYIQQRAEPLPPPPAESNVITDANFFTVVNDWLAGGVSKTTVIATYGQIGAWDVSQVTDMEETFSLHREIDGNPMSGAQQTACLNFTEDINLWNTGNVENMKSMFLGCHSFNINLQSWDTSKVTTMESMFSGAHDFAAEISLWNTEKVITMKEMFSGAADFEDNIGTWTTSSVLDMSEMFTDASNFNGDISNWDTSKVTTMKSMFSQATDFDGAIGNWDVSSVTNMSNMFLNAGTFNQNLEKWDISSIIASADLAGIFNGATTLNQTFDGSAEGGTWFATAEGLAPITNFYTDGTNYIVGAQLPGKQPELIPVITDANFFNVVDDWLDIATKAATIATYGEIEDWDVSQVTTMYRTFSVYRNPGAPIQTFNEDISNWNTGNVVNMESMFVQANRFDQDISNWNTSKVITMKNMFVEAVDFNKDIGNWDVSSVEKMSNMFLNAGTFNQNLQKWDISSITTSANLANCFNGATALNQTFDDSAEGGTWFATAETLAPITGFYVSGDDYPLNGTPGQFPTLQA